VSVLWQISGAKVRLHEAPREAATGQVQAAMKLVQAFLLAGNVEPLNIPDV